MTPEPARRGAAPSPGWAARMRRTERALAEAAVQLFIEQGYEATTVDEIAAAAGVSRRTFFRYFPAKEDVVLQPMLDDINQFIEALEERPAGEPMLTSLRSVATAEKQNNPHLDTALRLYRSLRYTPQLRGVVSTFISHFRDSMARWAAQRLDLPTSDFRTQLIAASATAAREAAMRTWVERGGVDDLAQLTGEAYDVLVGAALAHAEGQAASAGARR